MHLCFQTLAYHLVSEDIPDLNLALVGCESQRRFIGGPGGEDGKPRELVFWGDQLIPAVEGNLLDLNGFIGSGVSSQDGCLAIPGQGEYLCILWIGHKCGPGTGLPDAHQPATIRRCDKQTVGRPGELLDAAVVSMINGQRGCIVLGWERRDRTRTCGTA